MRTAGNVLIVEDDPDVREMLSTLLATEGFHAVAAEDGPMFTGPEIPVDAAQDGLSIHSHIDIFQFDQRECHFEWRRRSCQGTC